MPGLCHRLNRTPMPQPTLLLLAALLPLLLHADARAQFKVVDADGRVTYTDRPPTSGSAKVIELRRTPVAPDSGALASLPIELRQLMQRYPVVLYATPDCSPCDLGRQLLQQRGIPFSERKVVSDADVQAAERALGWRTMPSLLIGAQPLRGYTAEEWTAYLDAAGYPKESRLPRNWPGTAGPAAAATSTTPSSGAAGSPTAPAPSAPRPAAGDTGSAPG